MGLHQWNMVYLCDSSMDALVSTNDLVLSTELLMLDAWDDGALVVAKSLPEVTEVNVAFAFALEVMMLLPVGEGLVTGPVFVEVSVVPYS